MAYQPLSSLNNTFKFTPGADTNPSGTMEYAQPAPSMGVKAKSPQNNVASKPKTLPSGQTANALDSFSSLGSGSTSQTGSAKPTTPATPTSPTTSPTNPAPASSGLYGQSLSSLQNISNNGSPQVQQANQDLLNFKNQNINNQFAVQGQGNYGLQFQTGLGGLLGQRYAAELPAYQTALSNAQTQQAQQMSGLGTVASQTHPESVSPGNFYVSPQTGQDITGGAVNPFSGGQRQASVAQGGQYQNNLASIGAARQLGSQFISAIAQNPDFNASPANFANALTQLVNNQYSNPSYPGIQSSFTNMINQYANVLGGQANVINLIKTANPTSMQSLLQSLDAQANATNQAIQTAGTGGGAGTVPSATPQASASGPAVSIGTSGVTPGNIRYTVVG